jgi:prepilin-type N-terminal cleavage/methylation domain-containing protein
MLQSITNKKGYTLTELLVVITIIGMLTIGTFSSFGNITKQKGYLDTINEVDAILKEAHSQAIASRAQRAASNTNLEETPHEIKSIGVDIDLPTQKITVFQDTDESNSYNKANDEFIRAITIAKPASIRPMPGKSVAKITIMYRAPLADTNIYVDSDPVSRSKAEFVVADYFTDKYKRGTKFMILKSTGISLLSKLK